MIPRRPLLAGLLAMPALRSASAQSGFRPTRPVRFVVPFPAGSSNDLIARVLSEPLAERIGQPLVIEARAGAGGTIGADQVAKAAPDGHTLLNGTNAVLTIAPHLLRPPFNPLTDLAPVTLLGRGHGAVAVTPQLGVTTLRELLDRARAQPGALHYGSAGNGTNSHLWGVMLNQLAGTEMMHVPYRGGAPAVQDLLAGRIQVTLDVTAVPAIQAGQLRGLAVTSATRWHALPDVPTMEEAGLSGFKAGLWWGIMAPGGTPEPVRDFYARHIAAVLAMPQVAARLQSVGVEVESSTPAELGTLLRADHAAMGEVIRAANIRVD